MTPRLAVTQEQAEHIIRWGTTRMALVEPLTLRLPERPTMPCPECGGEWRVSCDGPGSTPIPEGTRVEVVYPCDCSEHQPGMRVNTAMCPHNRTGGMVPVAFATLTEVKPVEGYWPDDDYWLVVLSDLRPIDG